MRSVKHSHHVRARLQKKSSSLQIRHQRHGKKRPENTQGLVGPSAGGNFILWPNSLDTKRFHLAAALSFGTFVPASRLQLLNLASTTEISVSLLGGPVLLLPEQQGDLSQTSQAWQNKTQHQRLAASTGKTPCSKKERHGWTRLCEPTASRDNAPAPRTCESTLVNTSVR